MTATMKEMPIALTAKYTGNEAIDEYDFAMDLLRTARLALYANSDPGLIEDKDIASISYVMTYALDSLELIRAEVNKIERDPPASRGKGGAK